MQTTELLFLWRSAAQTRKIKDDLVRKISCEAKAKRQSEIIWLNIWFSELAPSSQPIE